jgi:hypothetical protein
MRIPEVLLAGADTIVYYQTELRVGSVVWRVATPPSSGT